MPKANGTVMVKYIKIKSGGKGVKACADYINNPEKTTERISEPPDTRFVANIKRLLKYAEEDKKTFDPTGRQYVSGLNCNPDTAAKEFSNAEKAYHLHHQERLNEGHKANQAYHIILSYKGTDMTPELVHKLGKEFAQRICRNNYQAVVATHLNTDNYHNHILINAYARDGSHKLQDQKNFYKNLRYIADSISREHNLPVNGNGMKYHPKPYKSWAAEQKRKKEMYMRLRTGVFGEQYLHNGEQKSFRAYKNRYKDNYRGQNFYSIDEYGLIKVNDYDIYGRRRLELEKLFLCVVAGIREGYYHALLEHQEEIKIYEQVQQAIEVVKKYEIADPEQIDSKLRYYHGMKNAGQKEIRAANSDDAYMSAAKKIAEATEAIRAIYKLKMALERSDKILNEVKSFIQNDDNRKACENREMRQKENTQKERRVYRGR